MFRDDDLKRLKDYLSRVNDYAQGCSLRALVARLQAAERCNLAQGGRQMKKLHRTYRVTIIQDVTVDHDGVIERIAPYAQTWVEIETVFDNFKPMSPLVTSADVCWCGRTRCMGTAYEHP